jgi:F-type H+-transporting ATPase subunit a
VPRTRTTPKEARAAPEARALAEGCHIFGSNGCGYPAPSLESFLFKPIFSIGPFHFTKPMLLALIAAALVTWFFWSAPSAPPARSPESREMGLMFVRDEILRPMMGKRGDGYLPFLVSLFFFIWVMNLMEILPLAQFPPMSRIAFPVSLMLMVYVTYTYVSIKRMGLGGYFKSMIPSGVPIGILVILAPVEILQYTIVRPFTLAVRLFANMFAGHILVAVFTIATWYLFQLGVGLFQRHLVRADDRADDVRAADPGPSGVHLHHPDRPVHRRRLRGGALRWAYFLTTQAAGEYPSALSQRNA